MIFIDLNVLKSLVKIYIYTKKGRFQQIAKQMFLAQKFHTRKKSKLTFVLNQKTFQILNILINLQINQKEMLFLNI